jgi:hypothetical protein
VSIAFSWMDVCRCDMLTFFADAKRVLPVIYNTKLDERERRSRELLQDLLEASPTRSKKR